MSAWQPTPEPGASLPAIRIPVTRADLVRYAGASGDFNPIHWSERVATSVGLPNVIAHGLFTMAAAVRVVSDWTGDPGAVIEYSVRFTRPVPVPDTDQGTVLEVSGIVTEVAEGRAKIELTAVHDSNEVLGKAVAVVLLPQAAQHP